jgi:hypothetical protein
MMEATVSSSRCALLWDQLQPLTKYSIAYDDPAVAAAAALLLGRGQITLAPVLCDEFELLLILSGGSEDWFESIFDAELSAFVAERCDEIADALDSILPGHHRDRALYLEALELIEDPERRALWRAAWLRDNLRAPRSICGRAAVLAAQLRAGEAPDW